MKLPGKQILVTVTSMVLAGLVVGCSRPAKGPFPTIAMTPPPGAINVERSDSAADPAFANAKVRTVTVRFDHPGGWQAVSAYYDQIMLGLGYKDVYPTLQNMSPGEDSPFTSSNARHYQVKGDYYMVMVSDMLENWPAGLDRSRVRQFTVDITVWPRPVSL